MAYTSLHRALGIRPGKVTSDMVAQAVASGLAEAEDLDWKHDADDLKDNREIAKDFAAMANASGGLIIVGVTEDGSDHAQQIAGVDAARARNLVRQFREVASSRVRPFIPALQVYSVPTTHDPDQHLIVVDIPRSPEAPHLVSWDKETMRYPRRLGADTVWLGETELEAAYSRRFQLRQESATRLSRLNEELRTHLQDAPNRVWLIVTATCSTPAADDGAPAVNPGRIDEDLRGFYNSLPAEQSLLHRKLGTFTPRAGFRRAVFSSTGYYNGQSSRAHLELHLDGTFGGALSEASATEHPGSRLLTQLALETGIRDLIAAAAWHADNRGASGTLQLLADIHSPYAVTLAERGSLHDEPLDESITLTRVSPVYAEAPVADLAADSVRRTAITKSALLDLTHQFAVATLLLG